MTLSRSSLKDSSKTGPETHFCPSAQVPVHVLGGSKELLFLYQRQAFNEISRFFETEGIAVLTILVSQFKITVKEEPQFAHETFEERKARILACHAGLTVTYVFPRFESTEFWVYFTGQIAFLWLLPAEHEDYVLISSNASCIYPILSLISFYWCHRGMGQVMWTLR